MVDIDIKLYENRQYNELEGEIFKDVENYKGKYQISNYGRVRSLPRYSIKYKNKVFRDGIILKQNLTAKGYLTVSLYNNGKPKRFTVHRLVGGAFISNSNNLLEEIYKNAIE